MKKQFTRGEWIFNWTGGFIWNKKDGSRIAEFSTETIKEHIPHDFERIANAKLMTAAPELLEALNTCVRRLKGEIHAPFAIMEAEEAIKKATE